MAGIKDLGILLASMEPELYPEEYVFCTGKNFEALGDAPVMIFKEKEGTTLIIAKDVADHHGLAYEGTWAMVSLHVHSDLAAVGLLAAITNALAGSGISVNAVSAYYHDHLFVPYTRSSESMSILKSLSAHG